MRELWLELYYTLENLELNQHRLGPLLVVGGLKNCTRLWREAHCPVKIQKIQVVPKTHSQQTLLSHLEKKYNEFLQT